MKNSSYKENLLKLEEFVMVKWLQDTTIKPRVSAQFGFYKDGQVGNLSMSEIQILLNNLLNIVREGVKKWKTIPFLFLFFYAFP